MQYNIYESIVNLENEITMKKTRKANLESSIGMLQLYTVYSLFMHEYIKKIEQYKKTIPECEISEKLITVEVNGKKYHIVFDFLSDYSLGEYHPVEELSRIVSTSTMDKIHESLGMLETILMNNVHIMYESLKIGRKHAHIELRRLIKSKKKPYLYYYGSKELKKKSMGFIVIEE